MPVKAATRQFGQFENLFKNLGDVADGFPRTIDRSRPGRRTRLHAVRTLRPR